MVMGVGRTLSLALYRRRRDCKMKTSGIGTAVSLGLRVGRQ